VVVLGVLTQVALAAVLVVGWCLGALQMWIQRRR